MYTKQWLSCVVFNTFFLFTLCNGFSRDIPDMGIPIPDVVKRFFHSAYNLLKELSKTVFKDNIDIHNIPFATTLLCDACYSTMEVLIISNKYFLPHQVIEYLLKELCLIFENKSVCEGAIGLNAPIFIEILKRKPSLKGVDFCNTIFESYCAEKPLVDWSINIANQTKKQLQTSYSVKTNLDVNLDNVPDYYSKNTHIIEIAHVTDTHVDLKYAAGAKAADCKEPLCCRNYQGKPTNLEDAAGFWGDYRNCDVPQKTVENVLHTLANNHKKINYVYMTGDLVAHNVWETSREDNIKQIQDQATLFHEILRKDVMIYPVLGNHEPHPANVMAPPEIEEYSSEWLLETFYDVWCKNFPQEAKTTFMKGGYYTVTPSPGFRIIGLNSMFGYVYNWWMILDPVDPSGQLQWLADTLLQAESRSEKVHILMHGPPAESDTLHVWKREYSKIVERFQKTITGQFLGHTHRDQFYVHYSAETSKPISVAWNAGSVTPYTNVNPNYRIYSVNENTMEVEEFDTYIYNLTQSNIGTGSLPNWFKLYSFKKAYDVKSLSPEDIDNVIQKLAHDKGLFKKYFLYYMKNSDIAYIEGCNKSCRKKLLCKMVLGNHNLPICKNKLQE